MTQSPTAQRPIPTPEMIEAGCSAGWGVGEGRVSVKQVIAVYRAMRVLDPAPLPIGWEHTP
jgi:hypothetical protein